MRTDTPKTPISRDLWMRAVNDICGTETAVHPEALTIQEFAKLMQVSRPTAARMMTQLVQAKKARVVRKKAACEGGHTGVTRLVPAYLLVDEP